MTEKSIVVGVDGSPGSRAALKFAMAMAEAARRGWCSGTAAGCVQQRAAGLGRAVVRSARGLPGHGRHSSP